MRSCMPNSSRTAKQLLKATRGAKRPAAVRETWLADRANQYVDSRKPWMLAKDPKNVARCSWSVPRLNLSGAVLDDLCNPFDQIGADQGQCLISRDGLDVGRLRPNRGCRQPSMPMSPWPSSARSERGLSSLVRASEREPPHRRIAAQPHPAFDAASIGHGNAGGGHAVEGNSDIDRRFLSIDLREPKNEGRVIAGGDKL